MRTVTPLLAVTALSAQLFCAQIASAGEPSPGPAEAEEKKPKPKPKPAPKPEPRPSGNGKRSSYDDPVADAGTRS